MAGVRKHQKSRPHRDESDQCGPKQTPMQSLHRKGAAQRLQAETFKKAEESVIFAVASKTDFVGELGVPLKDLRDCSKDTVVVKWATAKLMSYPGPLQRSSQLQQQKAPAANRLVLSDGVPVVQVKPTAKGKVASQLTALAGSLKLRRNALVAKLGSSKSRKPSKFVIEESSDDDEEDIKLQGSSCRPLVDSTQAWHAGPTSQGKHAGGRGANKNNAYQVHSWPSSQQHQLKGQLHTESLQARPGSAIPSAAKSLSSGGSAALGASFGPGSRDAKLPAPKRSVLQRVIGDSDDDEEEEQGDLHQRLLRKNTKSDASVPVKRRAVGEGDYEHSSSLKKTER